MSLNSKYLTKKENREISRPDLKTEVYKKLMDMIKVDTTNL